MLRWITIARSWHVLIRIGIATIAVAAAAASQLLPIGTEVPGEPFLLNFIAVVVSASVFGRTPGFFAAAGSTIAAFLYFEPILYSGLISLTQAVGVAAIVAYAAMAALCVEAFCRFVDAALAERSAADSARTQRHEALTRLAAIVTSSTDAIVTNTLDGTVTSWSGAAESIFGYAAGEMTGQSIRRLIPVDRRQEEDLILARLARGEPIERYETIRIAKDGRTINVSVTILPARDAEDRVIGALISQTRSECSGLSSNRSCAARAFDQRRQI